MVEETKQVEKSPIADVPMKLLSNVVPIDSRVLVKRPTQSKAEFLDDSTDNLGV